MPDLSAAQAALSALRAAGVTQAEVARELGVSSRMLRHVAAGTKGANLTGALQQLATRGRVVEPPPRREQLVRAPGGGRRQVTAAPPAPATPRRFGVSTTYTRGGKLVDIQIPRSAGAQGRRDARFAITDELQRGVAGRRERLRFTVTTRDGRRIQWARHGQSARAAARSARITHGGDGLDWLAAQFQGTEYEDAVGDAGANIVGVELEWF